MLSFLLKIIFMPQRFILDSCPYESSWLVSLLPLLLSPVPSLRPSNHSKMQIDCMDPRASPTPLPAFTHSPKGRTQSTDKVRGTGALPCPIGGLLAPLSLSSALPGLEVPSTDTSAYAEPQATFSRQPHLSPWSDC